MGKYSIADLESLSGIKAHTIRIWEQRYGLLKPQRTSTNIRFYDDEQLKRLLNITVLLKKGIKISEVSNLSENQINLLLLEESQNGSIAKDETKEVFINNLVQAGIEFDEYKFDRIFSTCLLRMGLETAYQNILFPFMERIGVLWGTNEINPAQEHFLSNLIRQKLLTATDAITPVSESKISFILFLHQEEDHEIGLLFANYLLRKNKIKVIYLGQRVPEINLKDAVVSCKPTHLMTFITKHFNKYELSEYLERLSASFPKQKLIVSGNPAWLEGIDLPKNMSWIRTIEEFKTLAGEKR